MDGERVGDEWMETKCMPFIFDKPSLQQATVLMDLVNLDIPGKTAKVVPKQSTPSKKRKADTKEKDKDRVLAAAQSTPTLTLNLEPLIMESPDAVARDAQWGDEMAALFSAPFDVLQRHNLKATALFDAMIPLARMMMHYQFTGCYKIPNAADEQAPVSIRKLKVFSAHVKSLVIRYHPHAFRPQVLQKVNEQIAASGSSIKVDAVIAELNLASHHAPRGSEEERKDNEPSAAQAGDANGANVECHVQRARHFGKLLADETMMLALGEYAVDANLSTTWGWQVLPTCSSFLQGVASTPAAKEKNLEGVLAATAAQLDFVIKPAWIAFTKGCLEFVLCDDCRANTDVQLTVKSVFPCVDEAHMFLGLRALHTRYALETLIPECRASLEIVFGKEANAAAERVRVLAQKELSLIENASSLVAWVAWWRDIASFKGLVDPAENDMHIMKLCEVLEPEPVVAVGAAADPSNDSRAGVVIKKEPGDPSEVVVPAIPSHAPGRSLSIITGGSFVGMTIPPSVARIFSRMLEVHILNENLPGGSLCADQCLTQVIQREDRTLHVEKMPRNLCMNFIAPCTHIPVVGALPVCEFGGATWYLDPAQVKGKISPQGSPAWAVREVRPRQKVAPKKKEEAKDVAAAASISIDDANKPAVALEDEAKEGKADIEAKDPKELTDKKNRTDASTLEVKTRVGLFEFTPPKQRLAQLHMKASTTPKASTYHVSVTHYFLVPRESACGLPAELTRLPLSAAKTKEFVDEAKEKAGKTKDDEIEKQAVDAINPSGAEKAKVIAGKDAEKVEMKKLGAHLLR